MSLLPLVEGAHLKAGVGGNSGRAAGLPGGQEELDLRVTLPEVTEDEDGSDPYVTWHALYGTYEKHRQLRWFSNRFSVWIYNWRFDL